MAGPLTEPRALTRDMGLLPALASNMLDMVGVGPFITIPLLLSAMGGPQALLGWVLGAAISLCDGLVWAELGAAMPGSGGSYDYLQQAFGPRSLGRLMGFLFLWQVMMVAPLMAASGAVGMADYARFLAPALTPLHQKMIAVAVCLAATALLYRDIRSIGRIATALWLVLAAAVGTILWGGIRHFDPALAFAFPPGAFAFTPGFFTGLGAAALISIYDYSGYFNVCLIGGEIKKPAINIPRTILWSIGILAVVYLAMSLSIIGVLPAKIAMNSTAVVADYIARLYGPAAAVWMTVLILLIAFASVFCVLLGFTRVPYAAAVEGDFFSAFARVHATRHFPSFSVVFLGLASAAACLFSLDVLIKELIVLQILTQFVAQCCGLVLIRRRRKEIVRPFRMPLYPLPVVLAIGGWLFVLLESGAAYIASGVGLVTIGSGVYVLRARHLGQWPFSGDAAQGDAAE